MAGACRYEVSQHTVLLCSLITILYSAKCDVVRIVVDVHNTNIAELKLHAFT